MITNPCYGCEKRHTRCHADCQDYDNYAKQRAKENERRKAEMAESNDYRAAKRCVRRRAERNGDR